MVLALLLPLTSATPAHAQAPGGPGLDCPDNRLANPGFEAGFSAHGGPAELVGNGWAPWYAALPGVDVLARADGTLYALFESPYWLARVEAEHPDLTLDRLVAEGSSG